MPKIIHHEEHEEWNSLKPQHTQPVEYKGVRLDCRYRVYLLVEDKFIRREHGPKGIHEAQLLTYMNLAGVKTGLLIASPSFVLFVSFVVKQFCTSARVLALHSVSLGTRPKRQRADRFL